MKKKIIHVEHNGRLANRMFQYMFARSLQMHISGAVVSGCEIPEFGVSTGNHRETEEKAIAIRNGHDYNIGKISFLMNSGLFDTIIFSGFGMRAEYYHNVDLFRSMFFWKNYKENFGFGDEFIVIHIRLEDISKGIHEDYMPIPISFYRQLIEDSKLKPVFLGQIDQSEYCQSLRQSFPDAIFMEATTPEEDFNRIRLSKNILLSLSSFSWLAAYFSNAKSIHLPIYGILNPIQRPDINLLPLWDKRYHFYWLEPRKWIADAADHDHLLVGRVPLKRLEIAEMGHIYSRISI